MRAPRWDAFCLLQSAPGGRVWPTHSGGPIDWRTRRSSDGRSGAGPSADAPSAGSCPPQAGDWGKTAILLDGKGALVTGAFTPEGTAEPWGQSRSCPGEALPDKGLAMAGKELLDPRVVLSK